jgi:hypothetical protein
MGAPESAVWLLSTNFRDEDMFHWVYIAEPGTFSVFVSSSLEVHAFRRTDFTNALDPADLLSSADLPGSVHLFECRPGMMPSAAGLVPPSQCIEPWRWRGSFDQGGDPR